MEAIGTATDFFAHTSAASHGTPFVRERIGWGLGSIVLVNSVIGGVFNNADILRVDFAAEYTAESLEETADGYTLKLKAKDATVAYDRLVMQVDKKHRVPRSIAAYAASGLLIKTLRYSQMKDFGDGLIRPSVLETDSPLYRLNFADSGRDALNRSTAALELSGSYRSGDARLAATWHGEQR